MAQFSSGLSPALQPLAEGDSAALGWNSILKELRDQQALRMLENRLNDLSETSNDKRWRTIFHAVQDGLAVCDHDEVILEINNPLAALLGFETCQQAVGRKLTALLESHAVDGTADWLHTTHGSSAPFVTELRKGTHIADGVWRVTRVTIVGEGYEDGVRLWTIREITQQKLADEMRNQFVFTATHELRTPLANIKAYAETLAQSDDIEVAEQHRFFNVINHEATRLARFIDELLNVSQMESGAVTIKRGEVDVERMLHEVVENLRPQIEQKEQVFEQQTPAKLPKLRLDKDKAVAALVNLLGNAIKYTPNTGTVRLLVEVDEHCIYFHVVDTGIGIAEDELPRIGEKFFRSRDRRVTSIVGSGLGLAFAQEVARLHGGKLTIKSEINKGSQFTLVLPLT